ncbi:MAG: hypothetical protein ACK53W_10935 [Gemmatimonadota bacterium]
MTNLAARLRPGAAAGAVIALLSACSVREVVVGGGGGGGLPGGAYAFRMGGPTADEGRQVVRTADGGAVIVGDFTGTVDFDPSTRILTRAAVGGPDAFVARFDSAGALAWATALGGPGNDVAHSVAVAPDGRVVVVGAAAQGFQCVGGITVGTVSGPRDAFITVLAADGRCERTVFIGGAGSDEARAVALGAAGDLFLTGTYQGPADFDPTAAEVLLQPHVASDPSDVFVARYGLDATLRWAVPLAGRGTDQAWALRYDDVQQVVLAGTYSDTLDANPTAAQQLLVTAGGTDVWVASLTASGVLRWAERMGGTANDLMSPHALSVSATREVFVGGQFAGTMTLGTIVGLPPVVSGGGRDGFVVRISSNGLAASGFAIGGTGEDAVLAVQAQTGGALLVAGDFQGTVDFSRGLASRVLTATSPNLSSGADLYTARYSGAGVMQWAERLRPGTVPAVRPTASVSADASTFWIGGRFSGSLNADPGTGVATLTAAGSTDVMLARYSSDNGAIIRR